MNSIPSSPSTSDKKRVILVDDHPITRSGVAALLNQSSTFEVCAESDSAAAGLELILKLKPDLAIVDISLKESNGIALVKKLKELVPELPVLVMSMHDESLYAERALQAGARGYVMKQEASENILNAVRAVLKKELFLSEKMRQKMLHGLVKQKAGEPIAHTMDTLSTREMEVFLLIGNGQSTRHIAELLNISVKTVDSYREHLKVKLRIDNAGDLVHHAVQWVKSERVLS